MSSASDIVVTVRCVNYFRHSLTVLQVRLGWVSSRALLQQPDEEFES